LHYIRPCITPEGRLRATPATRAAYTPVLDPYSLIPLHVRVGQDLLMTLLQYLSDGHADAYSHLHTILLRARHLAHVIQLGTQVPVGCCRMSESNLAKALADTKLTKDLKSKQSILTFDLTRKCMRNDTRLPNGYFL
jgi:hypothetical protein